MGDLMNKEQQKKEAEGSADHLQRAGSEDSPLSWPDFQKSTDKVAAPLLPDATQPGASSNTPPHTDRFATLKRPPKLRKSKYQYDSKNLYQCSTIYYYRVYLISL